MSQAKKPVGRRTFLVGLLTGAGAVGALSAVPRRAAAKKEPGRGPTAGMMLYRRTKEAERYYRTLYA